MGSPVNTFNNKTAALLVLLLLLPSLLFLSSCNRLDAPDFPGEITENREQTEESVPDPGIDRNSNRVDNNSQQPVNQEAKDDVKHVRVGIYAGTGSWDTSRSAFENFFDHYNFDYALFDEKDAVSKELGQHYDAIIFPGGFAAEYKNYIPDHDNIINFVKEGGSFIGSCAGAYYASDILRWQGSDYQYPLGFFDGKGIGPLSGLVGWGEVATFNLAPHHPANDSFDHSLDFYYFDGPYFEAYGDFDQYEVLATYAVNDQPAVIAGRYGEGKYLLLGPHPEIGGYPADSAGFNIEGEGGAKWPWLHSSLLWFFKW